MKKLMVIVSIALITVMSISSLLISYASAAELILGDADLNGTVNVKDATTVQKHCASLIELSGEALICADASCDGTVNVKDATAIQKYVADIVVATPVGQPIATEPTAAETSASENTEALTETNTTVITEPETTAVDISEALTEPPSTVPTEPQGVDKMDTRIKIYFSNNVGWSTVNAYLYNESKGILNANWPGVQMKLLETNDYGEQVFVADVDVSEYNRVVFNNGKSQTCNASLSVASSGFFISDSTSKTSMQLGIYAYGESDYGNLETVKMTYPTGYKKSVYIWTPKGYDADDTSKKYSVIYLIDGQNQFLDSAPYNGGWGSDEVITSLMHNGGDGVILVGIDNSNNLRDSELTPNIGPVVSKYSSEFSNGTGKQYSDFVVNTVVKYMRENYNVSLKAEDNVIAGSSSGGIEAFYIGMEHPDVFGGIGSLSPAFMLFDKSVWSDYFKGIDFSNPTSLPRIFFYNGGGDSLEKELYPYARDMSSWLATLGYPTDKMTFAYEEKSGHNEAAWRMIMPEMVSFVFDL